MYLAEWTGDPGNTAKLLILLEKAAKNTIKKRYARCYHATGKASISEVTI
jgi:hypothetical protein